MYHLKKSNEMTSVHFESMTELLQFKGEDHYKEIPVQNIKLFNNYKKYESERTGWFGGSIRHANTVIDNALLGWTEGYENIKSKVRELARVEQGNLRDSMVHLQVRKRKKRRGIVGEELDIHKVYQGQLDKAWTRMEKLELEKVSHLVTLMIDVGGRAYDDCAESMWRAAVAVRLTDELIRAGKSVKIIVGSACTSLIVDQLDKLVTTSIVVKQYNEPLSMERLCAMSYLGFHRVFNFMARTLVDKRVSGDSGGSNNELRRKVPLHLRGEESRYVYVPCIMNRGEAITALANIYKELKNED